jgi:glycine hydroxymethyltransferase
MGIRIGAPAMTSRGLGEEDFKRIAGYVDTVIKLTQKIQGELPKEANKLKDFKAKVAGGAVDEINSLKKEISAWAVTFPLPI